MRFQGLDNIYLSLSLGKKTGARIGTSSLGVMNERKST